MSLESEDLAPVGAFLLAGHFDWTWALSALDSTHPWCSPELVTRATDTMVEVDTESALCGLVVVSVSELWMCSVQQKKPLPWLSPRARLIRR